MATISVHGNEKMVANYVKKQENDYNKLYWETELEGQFSFLDIMLYKFLNYNSILRLTKSEKRNNPASKQWKRKFTEWV